MDYANPSYYELIIRLALAILLAGLLGVEREALHKPAGLRTFMMVSLGAAGFTLAALYLAPTGATTRFPPFDPTRVIQGVLGGIGFLGAGTIIQSGGTVQGVTTASGIWVTGAIGVACGFGLYVLAAAITAMAFVILSVFPYVERLVRREPENEGGNGTPG